MASVPWSMRYQTIFQPPMTWNLIPTELRSGFRHELHILFIVRVQEPSYGCGSIHLEVLPSRMSSISLLCASTTVVYWESPFRLGVILGKNLKNCLRVPGNFSADAINLVMSHSLESLFSSEGVVTSMVSSADQSMSMNDLSFSSKLVSAIS